MLPEAVTRGRDGYLRVYYEKLGLKFQTYRDWLAAGAHIPTRIEDMTMTAFRLDRIRLAGRGGCRESALADAAAHAQQSFNSPDDAASALAAAVKSGAKQDMLKVLGANGEDIIDSGDEVADAGRARKIPRRL